MQGGLGFADCRCGMGVLCRLTALHLASWKGCTVTAKALIAAGADVHCKNNDGYGRSRRIARLFRERARYT